MPYLQLLLDNFLGKILSWFERIFLHYTRPVPHSLLLATVTDLTRSRAELIAENALLRQQLLVLNRQIKRPRFKKKNRLFLLLIASRLDTWRQVLLIIKPETRLHWHRQGFQLFWKFKSKSRGGRRPISKDWAALILQMARENRLWGAERIRRKRSLRGTPPTRHSSCKRNDSKGFA